MNEDVKRLFFDPTVAATYILLLVLSLVIFVFTEIVFGMFGWSGEPFYYSPARFVVEITVKIVQSLGCRAWGCLTLVYWLLGVFTYLLAVLGAAEWRRWGHFSR